MSGSILLPKLFQLDCILHSIDDSNEFPLLLSWNLHLLTIFDLWKKYGINTLEREPPNKQL